MWLNMGLCWKITNIRTTPVLVSYPKQVQHSPKWRFSLCCVWLFGGRGLNSSTKIARLWLNLVPGRSRAHVLRHAIRGWRGFCCSAACLLDSLLLYVIHPAVIYLRDDSLFVVKQTQSWKAVRPQWATLAARPAGGCARTTELLLAVASDWR